MENSMQGMCSILRTSDHCRTASMAVMSSVAVATIRQHQTGYSDRDCNRLGHGARLREEPLTGQVLLLQLLEALVLCLSHLALLLGLIVARPSNCGRLFSLPTGVDDV